jgi:hypothetical protein
MATDTAFADSVRANPAAALGGFDLTPDEVGQLTALTGDSGGSAQGLAARQSKSGLLFMGAHAPSDAHLAAGAPVMDHAVPVSEIQALHTPPLHIDAAAAHGTSPLVHDVPPPETQAPPPQVSLHDPSGLQLHPGSDIKLHDVGDIKASDAAIHFKLDMVGEKVNIGDIKMEPVHGGPPVVHGDGGAVLNPDIKLQDMGDVKLHPIDAKLDPGDVKLDPIDVKLDPGDVKLHPIDAKLDPGDVKLHPIDVKLHGDPQPVDQGPAVTPADHVGTGHAAGGEFWGPDGQQHPAGAIEHTSTGQPYYVDGQGHGHAFYPAGNDAGAEPAPGATVDAAGRYVGVDGQLHHVGYDPSHVPATVDLRHAGMEKAGGLHGGSEYFGSDGQVHQVGQIEHTSSGQAYYIDSRGAGHAFYPSGGHGAEPAPHAMVDFTGRYQGVDGQLHHVGYDPSQVPDHVQMAADHGSKGGGYGGGDYYAPDGQLHHAGQIEHTSTGQAYYVDSRGDGHPFYPAGGPGAEPAAHAVVDAAGRYQGVDGQLHHVGYDNGQVPQHVDLTLGHGDKAAGMHGAGEYYAPDGQLHHAGQIEHTSGGQAYYIDSHGDGHPFFPASGPGAEPALHATIDAAGRYQGVDGQLHHVGYDPGHVPTHVDLSMAHMEKGAGLHGGGDYYAADGQLHHVGQIEHTSGGQAYYVDSHGNGHAFYPAGGPGAEPVAHATIDEAGRYQGVDGQYHHVGYDPSVIPDKVDLTLAHMQKGGGMSGGGDYWAADGQMHHVGQLEHTSGGQAYYVDSQGTTHPFFPASGEGAAPAPNAHVDSHGFYQGIDGHQHHVGLDPATIPATEQASEARPGFKF